MTKFWNFRNEETGPTLYLDGVIAEDTWFEDEITPKAFKSELNKCKGDLTVWINSPGGDCIAASQIYSMLMDYKGDVTVKIDGMAASAASVIAMAGTKVEMAPTSIMMIHNPLTVAIGDTEEMKRAIGMLEEVKEAIINAYEIKSGISRERLSEMMDAETWMNANKAIELGFCDSILTRTKRELTADNYSFSRKTVNDSLMEKFRVNPGRTSINELRRRLELIRS